MTMTPNSPQELIDMNNSEPTKVTLDDIAELMSHVGYDDTLTTVKWLLTNLKDFHHERVLEFMSEGECDKIPSWVQDETRLNTILDILSDIT